MSGTPADRNTPRWGLFNLLSLINWKDCMGSPCEDKNKAGPYWPRALMPSQHARRSWTRHRARSPWTEVSTKWKCGTRKWECVRGLAVRLRSEAKTAVVPRLAGSSLAVSGGPSVNTSRGLWERCENSQLKCEELNIKFLHNSTTLIYFGLIGSYIVSKGVIIYRSVALMPVNGIFYWTPKLVVTLPLCLRRHSQNGCHACCSRVLHTLVYCPSFLRSLVLWRAAGLVACVFWVLGSGAGAASQRSCSAAVHFID